MKRNNALVITLVLLITSTAVFAATLASHDEKSLPATPGGTVKVKASFQDIEVRVRPGDTVHAVVDLEVTASEEKAKRLIEEHKPVFEVKNGEILIQCARHEHGFHFDWGTSKMKGRIVVEMPSGMNLNIDSASGDCTVQGDFGAATVAADTASGDVHVRGAMKSFKADTASGNVDAGFEKMTGDVSVDTASGDVKLTGTIGKLKADTASGGVTVEGLSGEASFDTASGDVTASWSAIPAGTRVKADTASGNVHLTFPGTAVVAGQARTRSGDITCDFPGTFSKRNDRIDFHGGEGAIHLDLDTASGDISILKAK